MGNKCSEQCVAQAEGDMRVTTPNTPRVPITITVPTVVIYKDSSKFSQRNGVHLTKGVYAGSYTLTRGHCVQERFVGRGMP